MTKGTRVRGSCTVGQCCLPHKAHGLCGNHYALLRRNGKPEVQAKTAEDRFWEKVDVQGDGPDDCWLWVASRNSGGYGMFALDGKSGFPRLAHRISYQMHVGPIPDGLTIDHLCRVPPCVRPQHLEAVTMQVNLARADGRAAKNARKTHCPAGHEYSAENTYVYRGGRQCRACRRRPRWQ